MVVVAYERWSLGSLRNDDGDGNQDVKKAIGLLRKTTRFLYISSPSLHDYDVKIESFRSEFIANL